jgi:hypothetical protein
MDFYKIPHGKPACWRSFSRYNPTPGDYISFELGMDTFPKRAIKTTNTANEKCNFKASTNCNTAKSS